MPPSKATDRQRWTIVERNGTRYVYVGTSHMVDGKKVNDGEYLGRLDDDGTLIPKKPYRKKTSAYRTEHRTFRTAKEYGAVHFLDCVQRRMGLGEDLVRSFGLSGTWILAMVEAQVLSHTRSYLDMVHEFGRTCLPEYYGLGDGTDEDTLTGITSSIGDSGPSIGDFYGRRIARANGAVAWDPSGHGPSSDLDGLRKRLGDLGRDMGLPEVRTGLATDSRGVPMMLRHYPGTLSERTSMAAFMDELKSLGKSPDECIITYDQGLVTAEDLAWVDGTGFGFVVPAVGDSKAFRRLLTEFPNRRDKTCMVHEGHSFTVWKTRLWISPETPQGRNTGGYAFSVEEIGTLPPMDAYVCFDSERYNAEVQALDRSVDALVQDASRIDSEDPAREFRRLAGRLSPMFDVRADGRRATVSIRNNSRSFFDNRAGMFVILCREGIGWEVAMRVYDIKCKMEGVRGFLRPDLPPEREVTGDLSRTGAEFVRFLALSLWSEISVEFMDRGLDGRYTVSGALAHLSSIVVVDDGTGPRLENVTDSHRELFTAMGFDVPEEAVTGASAFDYLSRDRSPKVEQIVYPLADAPSG